MELELQNSLLQEAEKRLRLLSPERLRVAVDFLTYLETKEADEATQELLSIPGLETALNEAIQEADSGAVVAFHQIRRHV